MAVTAAAAHVTVGFFLGAVDGSLLCRKELQGDREANWVESVWTYRLPGSHWSIPTSHTLTYGIIHLGCMKTQTKPETAWSLQHVLSDQR